MDVVRRFLVMKKKIENWLIINVEKIQRGSYSESIHIDEFVNFDSQETKIILDKTIEIANVIKGFCDKNHYENVVVMLNIDLIETQTLNGVLRNEESLLDEIDIYGMPEIILYPKNNETSIPLVEFYRSPLPFKITNLDDSITVFYREYRTFEEIINNEDFTRNLDFSFQNLNL